MQGGDAPQSRSGPAHAWAIASEVLKLHVAPPSPRAEPMLRGDIIPSMVNEIVDHLSGECGQHQICLSAVVSALCAIAYLDQGGGAIMEVGGALPLLAVLETGTVAVARAEVRGWFGFFAGLAGVARRDRRLVVHFFHRLLSASET